LKFFGWEDKGAAPGLELEKPRVRLAGGGEGCHPGYGWPFVLAENGEDVVYFVEGLPELHCGGYNNRFVITRYIMRFLKAPARVLGLTFAMSALAFASRSTRLRSEVDQFNDKLREQFSRKIDISDEFHKEVLVFSGNSNRALAEEICSILKVESGKINVSRFRDGEVNIEVKENVRGKHIFVIQPTSPPVNESLMELLLIVSTLRRSSSGQINVVIPYYGYARQDRKTAPRVPISAADVARLLETVGVDRVIVMDLHSGQAQGFFSPRVPCDNLQAKHVAINYFRYQNAIDLNNVVVVSPDAGGVARAKAFV
jgi:hypothetical protein